MEPKASLRIEVEWISSSKHWRIHAWSPGRPGAIHSPHVYAHSATHTEMDRAGMQCLVNALAAEMDRWLF